MTVPPLEGAQRYVSLCFLQNGFFLPFPQQMFWHLCLHPELVGQRLTEHAESFSLFTDLIICSVCGDQKWNHYILIYMSFGNRTL